MTRREFKPIERPEREISVPQTKHQPTEPPKEVSPRKANDKVNKVAPSQEAASTKEGVEIVFPLPADEQDVRQRGPEGAKVYVEPAAEASSAAGAPSKPPAGMN